MSGAEPCTGSKIAGRAGAGSDARARGHAHPALEHRGDVGEHVAEEVRGDHDVEARAGCATIRAASASTSTRSTCDVRMLGGDLLDDLVPEHVAVA